MLLVTNTTDVKKEMNIFKLFEKKNQEKSVVGVLYPSKIIIQTRDKRNDSTWVSTDNSILLPSESTNEQLGLAVLQYLNLSKEEKISNEEAKEIYERFKKKYKFRSDKAVMADSRYVGIVQNKTHIRFEPKQNKISYRAYYGMPNDKITIDSKSNAEEIGKTLRSAWDKCLFIE